MVFAKTIEEESYAALSALLSFAIGSEAQDLARHLIRRHQSLGAIFALSPHDRDPFLEQAPRAMHLLRAARTAMLCSLRADATHSPFGNARAVVDYLRASMSFARVEIVRILYIDARHRLVGDTYLSRGDPAMAPLPVRDIVKAGLVLDATGFFIAHNHPSGDPTPSRADRLATARLRTTANAVGLILHDHLIFASSGWTSFRALGLLETTSTGTSAKVEDTAKGVTGR